MNEILTQLGKIGIVPVIKIDDPDKAAPLADALAEGGITCAEITFRTSEAAQSIRRLVRERPDMLAGAGTVVSVAQVDAAIDAGARFIVSPGFSQAVVTRCIEERIPVVPGCVTSTEMMWALEEGLEVVKFFPAEQAGGLPYLKAVSAPFPALHFMPTGGINAGNIGLYSGFTRVLACGATWMAAAELIREENYEEIARRSKEAVDAVIEARAGHARASLRVV